MAQSTTYKQIDNLENVLSADLDTQTNISPDFARALDQAIAALHKLKAFY
jgi:hypothetical protein